MTSPTNFQMSKFQVKFYKGEYRERQRNASRDKAICYVEHHFNMTADRNTSCVIVGSNASKKSIEIAADYAKLCTEYFGTKLAGANGVVKGGYQGRGNANVYYTNCPAVLLEPLFCGNPKHVQIIKSELGQQTLAEILVLVIQTHFPSGGLIAFSVGHKYKLSKPKDRGAELLGGGSEADYAEKVLLKAATILTQEIKVESEPLPIKFSEDDDDEVSHEPSAQQESETVLSNPSPVTATLEVAEIPTETKVIPNPEPVGFKAKITKIFTAITGGTFSLAMLKEWLQIQISPETLALLKLILPTLLVLAGVAVLFWFVAEKMTNWKITKLTADINSDKSRHDIEVQK